MDSGASLSDAVRLMAETTSSMTLLTRSRSMFRSGMSILLLLWKVLFMATLKAIRAAYRAECERAVPGRAGRPSSRLAQLRAAAVAKQREIHAKRKGRHSKLHQPA